MGACGEFLPIVMLLFWCRLITYTSVLQDDNVAGMNQDVWNLQQGQQQQGLQAAQPGQWSNQGHGQGEGQVVDKGQQNAGQQDGWGFNFANQNQVRPESDLAGGRQEAYMDNKMAAHNVEGGGWNAALVQKGDWQANKPADTGDQAIENPMQIHMPGNKN